jgi:putative DNA primase/helicase
LELLEYLCNNDAGETRALYEFVLNWTAYPIQHPGAKMATAILMHGSEGTGKNTFFGAVRRIYGRYAAQFSQTELESQFNGWASGLLFAIGNEVVSRAELYHVQGRLKSMITEPEWIINEKNLPARLEDNHCNLALFSNRIDIAKIDPGDRRFAVVWTPPALPESFYAEITRELADGGTEALHDYLLHLPLGDFGPHSKPPMTTAKAELIDLGMDSTERFLRDLMAGDIPYLPKTICRSDDLYAAYRLWCMREGIGKPAQKQTLLTVVGKRPGIRKAQERLRTFRHVSGFATPDEEKRTVVFFPGYTNGPDDGSNRVDWIGLHVSRFAEALAVWKGTHPQ